ncbi:MAG: hypothetical protein ACI9EF_000474 [Pseudohongiellaceae bacterium]|jgi:hypothetical protein
MLSLTVLAALAAFSFSVPAQLAPQMPNDPAVNTASGCIADGESQSVCVSMKVPESWGVSASAKEKDALFDDPLGSPSLFFLRPGVLFACITITNDGGDLSGPNGEVQTGAVEGDCIEVDITMTVTSPRSFGFTLPLIGGGISFSGGTHDSKTESQIVCAC